MDPAKIRTQALELGYQIVETGQRIGLRQIGTDELVRFAWFLKTYDDLARHAFKSIKPEDRTPCFDRAVEMFEAMLLTGDFDPDDDTLFNIHCRPLTRENGEILPVKMHHFEVIWDLYLAMEQHYKVTKSNPVEAIRERFFAGEVFPGILTDASAAFRAELEHRGIDVKKAFENEASRH